MKQIVKLCKTIQEFCLRSRKKKNYGMKTTLEWDLSRIDNQKSFPPIQKLGRTKV